MRRLLTFLLVSTIMATAQKTPSPASSPNTASTAFPNADELNQMAARFAPVRLEVDLSALSAGDKKALAKLIEAGRIVNHLFMQQFWSGDLALYQKLQQDKTPLGKARLHYFWINKGPWSEIDEHKAFLPGVPAKKPAGANFYPEDMTKEEFESWVKAHPDQKEQAEGFFTVVRRDANKQLKLVPYNVE
ncbi:MAG: MutT/NUDIX family protein, partial [Candidatus Angelobacter sp.]|nr:MutT/NUDIX family protein [Candidatus Angelobacter sp.]